MAVIGKIREKSTFLLIIVGGAMAAFILTDLFSSRSSVFSEDYETIGVVNDYKIKAVDFNNRLEKELENFKTRENRSDVPEFVQGQLREQVWNQYLGEFVLNKEVENIGITVTSEELADMTYGDHPHPQVVQAFTNPNTGQFNKNDVINFLKNMDQDEKTKNQWLMFETSIKNERRMNKYYNMISKGLYVTKNEAASYYNGQNRSMNISYVVKRYADIPDSSVTVTEDDIRSYYNEHEYKFQEKKSRKVEYAVFDVIPSKADSAHVRQWVEETYAKFQNTKDDSVFVNANSDREFDFRYYSVNDANPNIDSTFYQQDTLGYMVEPFIRGEKYYMMKLTGIKHTPDSVRARHILLAANKKNMATVRIRIDSINAALDAGDDFGEMARLFSVDPGSKDNSGDLGWFAEGFMIPVINDSCFNGQLNKRMIVESSFGLHILEVMEKSPVVKKVQVAIIEHSIDASRETMDEQFTASNEFSIDAEKGGVLEELALKYGARFNAIDIRENDNTLPDVESSRGLIRWAYNAEVGDVSEAQQYGSSFVIAKVTEIHQDGTAPLENVRPEAELGALKAKKAEKLIAQMQGYTSLEDASSKLGENIEQANDVIFESYAIPGLGREPFVLGKISSMNQGDLSVPLKGENGVFIVKVNQVIEPQPSEDYAGSKNILAQNRSSRVNFEVFEALKDRVEIDDRRYKFY